MNSGSDPEEILWAYRTRRSLEMLRLIRPRLNDVALPDSSLVPVLAEEIHALAAIIDRRMAHPKAAAAKVP